MGAVFAPMVGAMAADYVRQRGVWPGARRGANVPGVAAWAVGVVVGLLPFFAQARGWDAGTVQPAAVYAFAAAFLAHLILATAGAEAPLLPAIACEPAAPGAVEGG
jgi:hypothetical protein